MSSLGPFMGMMGGGGGGGAPAAGGQAAAAEAAPAEEEAPKEKTHYDVELVAFDAATKIKLIKEVRGVCGLGLKEAKECVETAPTWLMKELVKDEAEELKKKLEGLGATVRLA
jgi:large subunit ribosomal protein L7/L12